MALSDDFDKAAVFWNHRAQAVLRECCFVVVLEYKNLDAISRHKVTFSTNHDRVNIVFCPEVAEKSRVDLLEVVTLSKNDVVPFYFNVFVAFCVIVHMIVA